MRIIVLGSAGFLGSYVMNQCRKKGLQVFGSSSRDEGNLIMVDISSQKSILDAFEQVQPDCAINCAAMTDVDECERRPEKAYLANAAGPENLAMACSEKNVRLVHVSTDAVFDGETGGYSEDSRPNPVNVYAKTKLQGEHLVSKNASNHVLVRTNFYGLNGKKGLMGWVLHSLKEKEGMTGFDDVIFNPLWAPDLAECLVELTHMEYTGILNCAGDQVMSKYDFIKVIADLLGFRDAIIYRSTFGRMAPIARRPLKTYLLNKRMHELLNTKIHTLEEVLHDPSFDIYRQKAP